MDSVFRFVHIDGEEKYHYSKLYRTDNMEGMYTFADAPVEWCTRDEVNAYRKNVRKALQAKAID